MPPIRATTGSRSCISCWLTQQRQMLQRQWHCPRRGQCTTSNGHPMATTLSRWLVSCLPSPLSGTQIAGLCTTLAVGLLAWCGGIRSAASFPSWDLVTCQVILCCGTRRPTALASRWAQRAARLCQLSGPLMGARCWWPPPHPACVWTTPSKSSPTMVNRWRVWTLTPCLRLAGCLLPPGLIKTGHNHLSALPRLRQQGLPKPRPLGLHPSLPATCRHMPEMLMVAQSWPPLPSAWALMAATEGDALVQPRWGCCRATSHPSRAQSLVLSLRTPRLQTRMQRSAQTRRRKMESKMRVQNRQQVHQKRLMQPLWGWPPWISKEVHKQQQKCLLHQLKVEKMALM
mmetsp:Transcript_395/g.996  ORF Transcript_395/g.996 Transcript_395/m.996 type:complete len:343 (+) Transcript_395:740-1768(+)